MLAQKFGLDAGIKVAQAKTDILNSEPDKNWVAKSSTAYGQGACEFPWAKNQRFCAPPKPRKDPLFRKNKNLSTKNSTP